MLKKHSVLFGITISLLLLLIAIICYPGGSLYDRNAIGFRWQNNYLCNLFGGKALNGLDNTAQPWAIGGVFVLSVSFMIFFIEFSKKIAAKGAAAVIKYFGIGGAVCGFLVATPYHDIMVAIASTLMLVSMFYITVFVFKSKLLFFKILCTVCMLIAYCNQFIYYSGMYIEILPITQKVGVVMTIIWCLSLHYFTTKKDFQQAESMAMPAANDISMNS